MNEIITTRDSQTVARPESIEHFIEVTLSTIAKSSQQTYLQTYRQWRDWCTANINDPLNLTPLSVKSFLESQCVTRGTRQRQLSALRKLARIMATISQLPAYRQLYEALLLFKVPTDGLGGNERIRRALDSQQVWKALEVWVGDALVCVRNRALLSIMFYTGMRRSEIIALRWEDIDFENGTISVRHGKGDKRRDVAIVTDARNTAVTALTMWQEYQCRAAGLQRDYVFCSVLKGNKLGKDKPINARAVNQIVNRTTTMSGVLFTPHDARRTLGTDLLTNNNPLADVQAQLGHAHASTTLDGYAMPANARKRRNQFKTSY